MFRASRKFPSLFVHSYVPPSKNVSPPSTPGAELTDAMISICLTPYCIFLGAMATSIIGLKICELNRSCSSGDGH